MRLTVLNVGYPLAKVSQSTAGGTEQVLATLDKALAGAGHRSLVLAPSGSQSRGLLVPVRIPSGTLDHEAKQEAHRLFKQVLDRTVAHYSIDVVHMHGLDFSNYLPRADVPVIITLHLPLSWYATQALRPLCADINLVCVSKAQARTVPGGVRIKTIITNGVDLTRFRPQSRKGNYVLAMGRICPEKGFHFALDAAQQAGANLIIAGAVFQYPEHQDYFEKMIRPRLNGSARFIGPAGGARKPELLAGAKCLLVPSLAPETSSLIAMEAMASGTPVIAWKSGALEEIVTPGKTGFLVGSVQEMAEAMASVDSIVPSACRDEAEKRFSSLRMTAEYLKLYRASVVATSVPELQAA